MADDAGSSSTASKVQEAAANIHQAAHAHHALPRERSGDGGAGLLRCARRTRPRCLGGDVGGGWARERARTGRRAAPEGVRTFIGEMMNALPDLHIEIVSTTTEGDRCAVQWRLTGTFAGPGAFSGVAPTGHPIALEGVDLLTVRDGLIQANEAFSDTMSFPRQIGMMPPLGSAAEQRMMGAFNIKTRLTRSRGRGRAGGRGRVGGAGPARALQRVPDRGRRAA